MTLQVQPINQTTYDLAHKCALLLWHGVNFSTGQPQTSDAELLGIWSTKFQYSVINRTPVAYSLVQSKDLAKTAKIHRFLKLDNSKVRSINRHFNQNLIASYRSGAANAVHCVDSLAMVMGAPNARKGERIAATRYLFFTMADSVIFNCNGALAKTLQIPMASPNFTNIFSTVIQNALNRDMGILRRYTMPPPRKTLISPQIRNHAEQGGWWHRRVLDLAILIHYNLDDTTYARAIR